MPLSDSFNCLDPEHAPNRSGSTADAFFTHKQCFGYRGEDKSNTVIIFGKTAKQLSCHKNTRCHGDCLKLDSSKQKQ